MELLLVTMNTHHYNHLNVSHDSRTTAEDAYDHHRSDVRRWGDRTEILRQSHNDRAIRHRAIERFFHRVITPVQHTHTHDFSWFFSFLSFTCHTTGFRRMCKGLHWRIYASIGLHELAVSLGVVILSLLTNNIKTDVVASTSFCLSVYHVTNTLACYRKGHFIIRGQCGRAYSWFVSSQWETVLLCNDVSHWLGANLESALEWPMITKTYHALIVMSLELLWSNYPEKVQF